MTAVSSWASEAGTSTWGVCVLLSSPWSSLTLHSACSLSGLASLASLINQTDTDRQRKMWLTKDWHLCRKKKTPEGRGERERDWACDTATGSTWWWWWGWWLLPENTGQRRKTASMMRRAEPHPMDLWLVHGWRLKQQGELDMKSGQFNISTGSQTATQASQRATRSDLKHGGFWGWLWNLKKRLLTWFLSFNYRDKFCWISFEYSKVALDLLHD